MVNIEEIKKYLEENTDKKRLKHIYGVVESAGELAKHYGVDEEKAYLAALLHDCAKQMDRGKIVELSKAYGFEIDEIYLNVQGSKEFYGWIAYDPKNKFIIHVELGKRDEETLKNLFSRLKRYRGKTKLVLVDALRSYENLIKKYLR